MSSWPGLRPRTGAGSCSTGCPLPWRPNGSSMVMANTVWHEPSTLRGRPPCRFVLDSAAVRIDRYCSYQPDVLVYCGQSLPGDSREALNPLVVVEVLSPSNAMKDLRDKLVGYFRVPSIRHYLIVDP